MTITSSVNADGSELTIHVAGRFDFSAHQQFRDIYEKPENKPRSSTKKQRKIFYTALMLMATI